MLDRDTLQKVEIDNENKKLYIYFIQDNSMLMSNPPPPPSYYREVFTFDKLEFVEKEFAQIERKQEIIKWK